MMNLSNTVLIQLVLICKDSDHTNLLIRKFLNISDLKMLESRLAGCYEAISRSSSEEEKENHLKNKRVIEVQIDRENRRNTDIDEDLEPVLKTLPKEMIKKYETLLKDFKEGKY